MPSPRTLNLIFLLVVLLADHILQAAGKPDQVIECFRHGARTPIFEYDRSWPQSEGLLTTVGMLQHYDLGKKLAERYPHLVKSGYNPDDVYVLSNYPQRCIDSALTHISSMFRGQTSTLSKENPQRDQQESIIGRITPYLSENEVDRGEFVPIKVDVISDREQELIFNGRNHRWCKIMKKYRDENQYSAEMAKGWSTFEDSIKEANAFLSPDQQITDMTVLSHAFDAFIVDIYENRTLPGDITDAKLVESLNFGQIHYHEVLDHLQPIQKELTSFSTLNAVRGQLQNFREGKDPKRLALFSGHDSNLLDILFAFGITSTECWIANYQNNIQDEPLSFPNCQPPKFASNIIFEFYNDTANPYVKFYYNDVLIPLCDGQESCTYDNFLSLVQIASGNHTLQTWEDTCFVKPAEEEETRPEPQSESNNKSPNQDEKDSEPESNPKTEPKEENNTPSPEPEAGETTSIKTLESHGGVNKWFVFGSAIFAALALTFLLRILLKYKRFRRLNKQDIVKYRDETEVEA